ncbi:unnamed protein product [Euphydryas editha]|uniref:Adenylate kinase n=1 Tax=Euphydryas editha TaxID=104508 RepID=A0AAU9UZX3_EUPED|nr:unnamed protein product [Euphydryas editha]
MYVYVLPMIDKVNGERNPEEVYKDFRAAVLQILGAIEEQGMNGVGVGAQGIPGEIVGVEPAPARIREDDPLKAQDIDIEDDLPATQIPIVPAAPVPMMPAANHLSVAPAPKIMPVNGNVERVLSPKAEVIRVHGASTTPPTLWVVGGPGSNKATLCERAVTQREGWTHFSLGQRLRALADAGGGPASDGAIARTAISGGELVPKDLITKLVTAAITDASRSGHGIVLDGYPRDLEQMQLYENKFKVTPRMVLLDCSKLQLGRGRRDDSVAAFRRRLEVFREQSLPMLKNLDQQHRLVIVDGDTDSSEVQEEFTRVLLEEMEKAEAIAAMPQYDQASLPQNGKDSDGSTMQQFTHAVSRMGAGFTNGVARNGSLPNGSLPNGALSNGSLPNGSLPNGSLPNGTVGNGFIGMASNKVKPMMNNVSKIQTVSQMTHDQVRRLYEQSSGEITMNTHM